MFEILSILLIILGLSVLVVIHEAGHFFAAKWSGLLVEEFGFGLPPRFWGKKIGETIYSFNWLPFGGFVKIYGERHTDENPYADIRRSFSHQSISKRALIIVAGVLMNFLLGWLLISIVFMVGLPQAVLVTDVKEGSVAAQAGIQKSDLLTDFSAESGSAPGGKTIPEFIKFIDENKGQEVSLNIRRGQESLTVKVTPRVEVPEGEGNLGVFIVESGLPKKNFFAAIAGGFKTSLTMMWTILLGLVQLVVGIFTDISILERFIGPVGIVNVAIQSTKLGVAHFLQLLALISLNLAVFNVIPIPALDGGRLFFLLIEKIKGRAINQKTEMIVNAAGFAFLLFLILAITVKDILTLL